MKKFDEYKAKAIQKKRDRLAWASNKDNQRNKIDKNVNQYVNQGSEIRAVNPAPEHKPAVYIHQAIPPPLYPEIPEDLAFNTPDIRHECYTHREYLKSLKFRYYNKVWHAPDKETWLAARDHILGSTFEERYDAWKKESYVHNRGRDYDMKRKSNLNPWKED